MSIRNFNINSPRTKLSLALFGALTTSTTVGHAAQLEEVFVTAQKRAQSLRDVPISVSVTSGETLEQFSIGDIGELSASIPNVTIGQNATQDSITIRGVGSGANHGFEQSVGAFIDGVYFGRGRSSRSPFLDVERVEVLKGPQGVLFGKNTISGALNITTRKPSDEFESSIDAEYFDANESFQVTGIVSGPLGDNLGGRLVVKYKNTSGYINNIATGDSDPEIQETVARGTLVWDASDRLSVTLKGEMSSYDMDGRHLQMYKAGSFLELFQSFDPNYEQELDDKRSVFNPVFGRDFDNTEAHNLTATVDYDFDSVRLVLITAATGYEYDNNIPASWVANLDTAAKLYDEEHSQFSQELRLESIGEGSIGYIIGVFYQTEEIDHLQHFDFDTSLAIAGGASLPPFVGRSTFDLHQDTDSFAIFGQVTWHISDRIRANLGLRYTKDEKELDFSRVTTGALPFPTYTLVDEREDSDTTPSINIQADISDNVMVYASFSQGFKSGGFDFESGADFEEETVDAWEIGFKSMLFEGSVELNAAMFQSEFDDLQVAAWNGIAFETGNAAKATTKGLEIDGRWQITDSWMVWGAVAYLNAEYDRFPGATCTASQQMVAPGGPNFCQQDLTGGDLQFSPDWSGTLNLDYILQMGDFELTASLGVDYSADFFTALDLDPISQQGSYVKVNMRVELAADAGWSVALVGKNLTDEETTMWVNDVPFFRGAHFAAYDQSRNFGIQARYEF